MNRNKLLNEAQRAIERQQYDRAIRAYRSLLHHSPNDHKLLLKLAELYLRVRDLNSALSLYHKIANTYLQQGDHNKVTSVYKLIIKLSSTDVISRSYLLKAALSQGTLEDVVQLLWPLIKSYDASGDSKRAIETLETVYQYFPHLLDVRSTLAERSLEEGKVEQASIHLHYLFQHHI